MERLSLEFRNLLIIVYKQFRIIAIGLLIVVLQGTTPIFSSCKTESDNFEKVKSKHKPADPKLIPVGRKLLDWLYTLPGKSENKVISGQYHQSPIDAIHDSTGIWVGIMGDAVIYGEGGPWAVVSEKIQQQYIDYWNAGGIIIENFKPHNPKNKTSMKDRDFSNADMDSIVTPGTTTYNNFREWLDVFAKFDQKLEDRNIPLIFRPFHEMNCCFWYGSKDPEKLRTLWKYTFNYLTVTKGLHNLIFVYSVSEYKHNATLYYPGNEYVDIVGIDLYKDLEGDVQLTAANFVDYESMKQYGKPFAITEFGPHNAHAGRTPVLADYRKLKTGIKNYAPGTIWWFSWSVSWSMAPSENSFVPELLNDPWTINRDEIPDFRSGSGSPGISKVPCDCPKDDLFRNQGQRIKKSKKSRL